MSDPKAPRGSGPALGRRFYRDASIEKTDEGWALSLDGRRARTPAKAALALPTRALGEAIAAEWNAQGETIDPRSMPLTRLANSAIDGVAAEMDRVAADLARYARSDLIVYRAGEPDRLVALQGSSWDPVHAWARDELGAPFVLSQGVTFVEQPPASVARIEALVRSETSPFALAALHVMTTLTGSVLLSLMHAARRIELEAAWQAAHVDELFQEKLWGEDREATERRQNREDEFRAASRLYRLSKEG